MQAAAEAGAVYLAVRGRRREQAIDWAKTLKELSGLTDLELRRAVEDHPIIAELIGRAWEAAAETASEDKRRLLAKVAAASLRGDADADVDDLQFLLRTVIALEPAHITLLVLIGTLGRGRRQVAERKTVDWVLREELRASWSTNPDLLDPGLATLEREGLTVTHGLADDSGEIPSSLTNYGKRFLNFLLANTGGWPLAEHGPRRPPTPRARLTPPRAYPPASGWEQAAPRAPAGVVHRGSAPDAAGTAPPGTGSLHGRRLRSAAGIR